MRRLQDLCHQATAAEIREYPEVEPSVVTDVWHARRWHDFDRKLLNPMWTGDGVNHFYVDEVAQLRDGRLVMPLKWVTVKDEVHAECVAITRLPVRIISADLMILVCAAYC